MLVKGRRVVGEVDIMMRRLGIHDWVYSNPGNMVSLDRSVKIQRNRKRTCTRCGRCEHLYNMDRTGYGKWEKIG